MCDAALGRHGERAAEGGTAGVVREGDGQLFEVGIHVVEWVLGHDDQPEPGPTATPGGGWVVTTS